MKIDCWPQKFQKKRSARKRRLDFCRAVSSLSSGINGNSNIFAATKSQVRNYGGYNVVKYHLQVIANLHVHEKPKKVLVSQERNLLNPTLPFLCPSSSKVQKKVARKERLVFSHMAEGISEECPGPACSITRTQACQVCRKRKTKPKDESSDYEVVVPRRTHFRGQAWRGQNSCNTSTIERGKLYSATLLHYFTHIWDAFSEDKVKSFTCFDPLCFNFYADEKNRATVLNWIKETATFSKKYVLIPIVLWSHWSLLIFCHLGESFDSKNSTPCMLLLDSLHAVGPTRFEPLIRRLLVDMYKMAGRMETKEQLKKVPHLIPKIAFFTSIFKQELTKGVKYHSRKEARNVDTLFFTT